MRCACTDLYLIYICQGFRPNSLQACTTVKTSNDLGASHGYQTHKCGHHLEALPGHTLPVNVDQVEDSDEGLSHGERRKQQAIRGAVLCRPIICRDPSLTQLQALGSMMCSRATAA